MGRKYTADEIAIFMNTIYMSNEGCRFKIIKYRGWKDVQIEFIDYMNRFGEPVIVNSAIMSNIKAGRVKNPYFPSVYGKGMIGTLYDVIVDRKKTKEYNLWSSMLQRCYDDKLHERYSTYDKCEVDTTWLYFENFYEWYHAQENLQVLLNDGVKFALDKDILCKGNKIYGPEYCSLVPRNINTLFIKSDAARGDYPIGVYYHNRDNEFRAQITINGHQENLGYFPNNKDSAGVDKAFHAYKVRKEAYIKELAQSAYNAGHITKRCYDAMMSYEVEKTD